MEQIKIELVRVGKGWAISHGKFSIAKGSIPEVLYALSEAWESEICPNCGEELIKSRDEEGRVLGVACVACSFKAGDM